MLAAGVALFGAEGEYPQEFLDEFYDFDSNPTADTQDEETIAIAYAAWLESKRTKMITSLTRVKLIILLMRLQVVKATSTTTQFTKMKTGVLEIKYDDPTTYYDWNSQDEVDEDEVEEAIKEELGNEPEQAYGATLEVRSALNDKYVDVDVDMDTDYNEGRFMGMAART